MTGEDTLKEKQASIEKFWAAVTKGQEFVKANPEEGLKILLANENADSALDPEVEKESLDILLPLMEDEGVKFGYQDVESWKKVANWLYKEGVIEKEVDPSEFVHNVVSK